MCCFQALVYCLMVCTCIVQQILKSPYLFEYSFLKGTDFCFLNTVYIQWCMLIVLPHKKFYGSKLQYEKNKKWFTEISRTIDGKTKHDTGVWILAEYLSEIYMTVTKRIIFTHDWVTAGGRKLSKSGGTCPAPPAPTPWVTVLSSYSRDLRSYNYLSNAIEGLVKFHHYGPQIWSFLNITRNFHKVLPLLRLWSFTLFPLIWRFLK